MTQNGSCMKRLIQTLLLGVLLVVFAECTSRRVYADYSAGSGFDRTQIDSNTLRNLEVLGRVWGFVKYHYPAFSDDRYDLDFELFELLPQVADATAAARNEILASWIDGFGGYKTTPERYEQILASDSVFEHRTDIAWIRDTATLGRELSARLVRLRQADRTAGNYYVTDSYLADYDAWMPNPCFDREKAYKNLKNPDYGYRLLTVFRFWNMVEYFFPTKYLLDRDWDEVLPEYIGRMARPTDGDPWVVRRMIAELVDNHAQSGNLYSDLLLADRVPINVSFVEERLVVVSPDTVSIAGKREKPFHIGDEILLIDNRPIAYYLSRTREFIPCSNQEDVMAATATWCLCVPRDDKLSIRYRRGGVIRDTLVGSASSISWRPRRKAFSMLNDSIGYLCLGEFEGTDSSFIARLQKTEGLIVDLRYGTSLDIWNIISSMRDSGEDIVRYTYPLKDLPGVFVEKNHSYRGEDGWILEKPIVVLVNETVQSAGETQVQRIQSNPQVTVVGSRSAGADGNVSWFKLPGGIESCFSGLGWYYSDGYAVQRQGVKIDHEVRPTIRGVMAGRDEMLDEAIRIIHEQNKNNN